MSFFTFIEILNLIILTIAIGYIFSGYIQESLLPQRGYKRRTFDWHNFKFALLVSAPGVVFHELSHKFMALAFGLDAMFKIWFPGLGIAIFLKLIQSPFLIIAPGYVLITGTSSPLQSVFTAFAGPLINLIMWVGATFILNRAKKLTRRQATILYLTSRINLFLFIFNMIPIPPLDGSKVVLSLIKLIF